MTKEKRRVPAWLVLMIIALSAGLILAGTYELTRERIAESDENARSEARRSVFASAESFEELDCPEGFEGLYRAVKGDETVGYVVTGTYDGYSSPITITLGMDLEGTITGLSVGGSGFAETAGLGARVREEGFTSQFTGRETPVKLGDGVDAVSGATISSTAVVNGINEMADYVRSLL